MNIQTVNTFFLNLIMVDNQICLNYFAVVLILCHCVQARVTVNEGQQTEIIFPYYGEPNIDIALRIRNRAPFYQHGSIANAGLTEDQQERFSVKAVCLRYNSIEVTITIKNVKLEDGDTYICEVYRYGKKQHDLTKRATLFVDIPVGPTACTGAVANGLDSGGTWDAIECTARAGMHSGWIECYQDGERVPPITAPIQNTTTLVQKYWMKKTVPIFCCSSTHAEPKEKCECFDWYFDPLNKTSKESVINSSLCPTTKQTYEKADQTTPTDGTPPMFTELYQGIQHSISHAQNNILTLYCLQAATIILVLGLYFKQIGLSPNKKNKSDISNNTKGNEE